MFTVEIKVNGSLISHVYGRNMKVLPNGNTQYDYEYYQVESREITKGKIEYDRNKGIRPLVAAILIDVEKKVVK